MEGTSTDRSGLRRQRLLCDVDLIRQACTLDKNNPFCRKHYVTVTVCITCNHHHHHHHRVRPIPSADTGQYQWVSVSADTYLSIGADTSSPVVCLPVSTVNTVAAHAYSFKPIPYFCAYIPHTYITCTHLYPHKIAFLVQKICTAQYWYRYSCSR